MRICLYTETALPTIGEQELAVDALASQFRANGHEVVVLTLRGGRGARLEDAARGYPVVRHPQFISQRFLLGYYRRYLDAVYREYAFNVLHCHNVYPAGYVATLWGASQDVPIVLTSHVRDIAPTNPLLRKRHVPLRVSEVLSQAHAVIAINKSMHQRCHVLGADRARITRIPSGVDFQRYATTVPRPEWLNGMIRPGRYFLFLGRLAPPAGVDLLIAAYRSLIERCGVHLVIAGAGKEAKTLAAKVAREQLSRRVHFVGAVAGDDKTYLLQNALCTVVPSRAAEDTSLTVLESYAAGVPVIATQVPGLEESIRRRVTGLLVPAESPADLTDALAYLAADRARAHAWGLAAQRLTQKFDWRRIAQQHLELYASLSCSSTRRRAAA
jgi:glycosyltransferase involved in cell wall biosynthesis